MTEDMSFSHLNRMDDFHFGRVGTPGPGIEQKMVLHSDFEPFEVDIVCDEEQVIPIGGDVSVQVLFTPGHTRDMLSFYIPERRILIATESAGCRSQTGRSR